MGLTSRRSAEELNKIAPYFFSELKEVNAALKTFRNIQQALQGAFQHLYTIGYYGNGTYNHQQFKVDFEKRDDALKTLVQHNVIPDVPEPADSDSDDDL